MDAEQKRLGQRLGIANQGSRTEGSGERKGTRLSGIGAYLADIWELTWLPLALASVAAGVTWTVWNFTTVPCTPELADAAKCSLSSWAKFISLDLLNKMFTHGAIAGGTGGVWNYVMLRRERQRADEAERRLEEERQRAAEERQQAAEERQRAAEERQQAAEERQRAAEERQRYIEQIEALTERLVNSVSEQGSSE